MKISIITINFNNISGLELTFKSLLSQTFTDFEYIIIDGGSTDGSPEFIKENEKYLSYWVSEPDNGIYNAMNKGLNQATGEYCLFLNSGDYLYKPDVLSRVYNEINNKQFDIHIGDLVSNNGTVDYINEFKTYPTLYYLYYYFVPHPSSFIRRSTLLELGGYNVNYKIISDKLFFIEAILNSKTFNLLKFPTTFFELGGISTLTKNVDIQKTEFENWLSIQHSFLKIEYQNFKELRYYEISRPHQILRKFINLFK
jgi:glycosyltransferase involved in cell wall biosynthesis